MTDTLPLRRFVLVGVIAPAVLTAVALAIQLSLLPALPDPVAIHWDAAGRPDGFGPAWSTLLIGVAVGLGLPLLLAAAALPGLRRGDRGATYRLLGAAAAGLSTMSAVLMTWSLALQAGLDDAADAPSILPALLLSYALAAAAGAAAWFVQPRASWAPPPAAPAAPLALGDGERAVWMRSASMSRTGGALIAGACLVMLAATGGAALFGAPAGAVWLLVGLSLLLLILAATTVAFHVRVDTDGLHVDSVLGLPRMGVPLRDVSSAAVVTVNPMGEFGGWGLRSTPGRFGVILRGGEALEVTRRSGRRFAVTVDDAATAAALLQALVRRAESARDEAAGA
ncbi:DUF1648 domain-containing protein [Microbacterium thalassium]|uniref:DUF1648 domain-containing protein n=1 Tax=Microbacterium thalassium TaxID=362649 RepID=A0A7X0FRJ6_9MICO|nr:DUF1648 domain-containing protein [Microbacterium thalassium]MBB6392408.1 hypothetical protein [Microbacterium thalassium]GLK25059.1 hypothetical protein GCM10017607_23770 [Microbacterium thalassium]